MTYATVRAATSPELTYLRTQGQWSKLFLAARNPSSIYTARLASLPSSFDQVVQISFNTGSGTLGNVKPGMTLYVGSSAGAYDLGMARIRKDPIAGTFYIGETSEVVWQSNCYLTVVDDFDLWAKHINTIDDTTFYVDWDVVYTNQNSVFDPIPIMGSHRVAKLTGASVNTVWDFSNSYVIGSSISAYSVACATASGITGGTTSTPTITFNTVGWHVVYLTLTAANGKTNFGVRYVYVYNSANMPPAVFQLNNCAEDYDTGGWSYDATVYDGIALANVPERALCILFAEDHYGSTQTSIGQLAGCENIICVGRVSEEQYNINADAGEAALRVQGMQYWFSKTASFPEGFILTTATPTNWVEMQSPTVDKVLYRLIRWGSTAATIMDCYLTNDSRLATELNATATNLWAQIMELAFATIYARPGVDRFGRLFVEVEPQLVPVASRTWATVMTLTKADWYGNVNVQRVVVSPTGSVNLSGVVISSDGSGGALFSLSPGHAFKRYGSPESLDRLLLSTQSVSNQMAGLLLGWRNNQFPSSEFTLSSNNRMIDCFPRQKIAWSIDSTDTPRGFTLSGNFIPRRVAYSWDAEDLILSTEMVLEFESIEQVNVNGDIPGDGNSDLSDPPAPPAFPPLPDFPIILPSDITELPEGGPTTVIMLDDIAGIIYTDNFNVEGSVAWQFANGGIDVGDVPNLGALYVTPNGAVYVGVMTVTWHVSVYRAPAIGQNFVKVIDQAWLNANEGSNGKIVGFGYNPFQPEQIALIILSDSSSHFWLGSNTSWTQHGAASVHRQDSGSLTYGAGKWMFDAHSGDGVDGDWHRYSASGVLEHQSSNLGFLVGSWNHYRPGTNVRVIKHHQLGLYSTIDGGVTTQFTSVPAEFEGASQIGATPDAMQMMARWDRLGGIRGKSSDGGVSWSGLPNLPFGHYNFVWAGGTGTSSRWIAFKDVVSYSEDFGNTWNISGRWGNLMTLIPFPELVSCFIPGLKIT